MLDCLIVLGAMWVVLLMGMHDLVCRVGILRNWSRVLYNVMHMYKVVFFIGTLICLHAVLQVKCYLT